MTGTLFTSPDIQVDHRADMLRGLAAAWDPTIFAFDRGHSHDCPLEAVFGKDHCLNKIIDAMTAQAAEYADPNLPWVEIRAGMEQLRDAVHALARFECGEGWDGDEDEEKAGYSDETVLGLLNADIDWALWPLLSGVMTAGVCFRCSRSGRPVQRWNQRLPLQPNCAEHQS